MAKNIPTVLFNASVILAGLKSPSGGSALLLRWNKERKIKGLTSEIIVDEAVRNASRVGLREQEVSKRINQIFGKVYPPPKLLEVENFKRIVTDHGDAHVLASCKENNADFLVTLDKKHLLVLKSKVKIFKIVSPGELIEMYHPSPS